MAIIIEGMDATGKSTLAQSIAHHLNLHIKESEGPPSSPHELAHRIERYSQMVDTLFVRHPCVSHNIYNICHQNPFRLDVGNFYDHGHTFIYCAPTNLTHQAKPGEDETFIVDVALASDRIRRMYNMWAIDHAHIIYHMGDDPQRILDMLSPTTDLIRDVSDLHTKFDIAYDGPPRHLPPDLLKFREEFLHEEALEYATAPDLAHRFDALIDVVYVAIGSSHLHGFDFYEGWRRVHAANMLKVRAAADASDSLRHSTHDLVKPPGWRPPDLTDLCS
jgi:predicted HAD superfamily Cof-like phosphohydrolase